MDGERAKKETKCVFQICVITQETFKTAGIYEQKLQLTTFDINFKIKGLHHKNSHISKQMKTRMTKFISSKGQKSAWTNIQ